jgi:TP901 family phage tail tape measure protein
MSVRQLARRLGFPDTKDVAAMASQLENEIQVAMAKIRKRIDSGLLGKRATANAQQKIKELQSRSFFTDASARSFRNPTAAGRFFEQYAKQVLATRDKGEAALRAILQGTAPNQRDQRQRDAGPNQSKGPNGPNDPSNLAQAVAQAIKDAKQTVPSAGTSGSTSAKATADKGGTGPTKKKAGGVTTTRTFTDETGGLVEERRTSYPGTDVPDKVTQIRRTGQGRTVSTTIQGDMEQRTARDRVAQRFTRQFDDRLRRLAAEYGRQLPGVSGAVGAAQLRRNVITQAGALYRSNPQYAALGFRDRMAEFVQSDLPGESAVYRKSLDRQQRALMKRRQLALKQADDASRKQAEAEIDLLEDRKRAYDKFAQTGTRAQAEIAKERRKTSRFDTLRNQQSLFNTLTTQAAMAAEADLQQRGAKLSKENFDPLTRRRTGATYLLEENGRLNKYRVDYSKEAASMRMTSSQPKKPTDRLDAALEGLTGRNLLANLVKVSAWSAAVMVLYKSAELAAYSLKRLEETGMEMAHLDIVFRGVGGSVKELTSDMMKLGAAQGRGTDEVMESATAWARLGGDRKTINEEVRVSAVAANIANMHMSETTKQLMSLMHIYHMEAGDLNGTLGMLVNTSLKYNVTLEEMFTGLDRSAAAARVAGLGLAELQGMIAVVVGKTGQSGSVVGNTIKYMLTEFNREDVQRTLRGYGVETLGKNLQQKPAGEIIGELAGKWDTLGGRQQQGLTSLLGGRFSASRIVPIMEDYLQIQKLAIDGQLNLNQAQQANVKILDTLKAQLAGVHAEFDRLILAAAGGGKSDQGFMGVLATAARTGKNVLHLMANAAGRPNPWEGSGPAPRSVLDRFNDWVEGPVSSGQESFQDRMGALSGQANAYHQQRSFFELASTKLAMGKLRPEEANMVASELTPDRAKSFLENWQVNPRAAQGVLAEAKGSSQQAAKDAEDKRLALANGRVQGLQAQVDKVNASVTARQKGGETERNSPALVKELSQQQELNKAIGDVTAARDADWKTQSDIDGDVPQVIEMKQTYVNLLKEQAGAMEMIGRLATQFPAHTPTGQAQQEFEALQQQQALLAKAEATARGQGWDTSPEQQQLWQEMVSRKRDVDASLAMMGSKPYQSLVGQLTARQRGGQSAEYASRMADYGYDDADKLLRVRKELTDDIARSNEKLQRVEAGSAEEQDLIGRKLKDQELFYENNLDLRRRAADVEREIHQLAIDQNREFSRSFFGSGAADMLRKLAAFKLVLADGQHGVTQGQLFSMGPGMRQDVGNLTGMNPEMSRLLLEQNKLKGFAEGGFTGYGNPDEVAGVVHKGEYVLSQRDLFDLHHDNLYPRGTRLGPGGGVYRAAGIPLDDMDGIRAQMRVEWPKPLKMAKSAYDYRAQIQGLLARAHVYGSLRTATPDGWREWAHASGRSLLNMGRGASGALGRMAMNPKTWMNLGKGVGVGMLGGGVTSGLNWVGGRMSPNLRGSDTYGGAAFHVLSDAAGGAVAGARGGPLGMEIGAVSGMVIGDVARYYSALRDIHQNTYGASWRKGVDANLAARLQRQADNPSAGDDFERQMAGRREAAARERNSFDAKLAALDAKIAESEARSAKTMHQKSVDWAHPDAVSRMDENVIRVYKMPDGKYAQFWNGETSPHIPDKPKTRVQGFEQGGYTGDGPSNEVAGVVHRGEFVIPKAFAGGHQVSAQNDLTALKNASAALDLLAAGANRLNSAFASLASRVDGLFKNGAPSGGALQFAPAGQSGGWYPGRQPA